MPAIQVKLVRSWAGCSEKLRGTLTGLGLYRIDDRRILPDTPETLGMIAKVHHLVTFERVAQDYKPTGRRHTQGKKAV